MDLVTPMANAVFCVYDTIALRISLVLCSGKRVHLLVKALGELRDVRDDLRRRIEQAEFQGLTCTSQVRGWIQRVQAIEAEASSVIEDLTEKRPCFWCCTTQCKSIYKNSARLPKKIKEIHELIEKQGLFEKIFSEASLPIVEEIPSKPTVGLNLMMKKVFGFLGEEDVGIIGIYGMGGVGKTTLLKNINNEFLTKSHDYDVVIWVSVSRDFVVEKIHQAIEARLGLSSEGSENHEQRASNIYRILRRKSFLLLLDDVWEGLDFEKIGIPAPIGGNHWKVIFSSRSMDVCSDMDAHRKLKVEFLGEKESWQLFCEKLGPGREMVIQESNSIRRYAETIVRKCGGLPLALITIGRAMSNKETEEEWKYAIEVFGKCPSELRGMEDIFALLKFSYENLENDTLRSCFMYCSLFPGDHSIEKEQLIEYWIGEGFLDSFGDSNLHRKGQATVGSLKTACLLENGEEKTQVKMHDVVRSFALWIASEYGSGDRCFLVEASTGLTEAPKVESWQRAQRISLVDNGITSLLEVGAPFCPGLSTLLLQWNRGLNKIPDEFFRFMPVLKVLDLSFTSIKEIPGSIGSLVQLQHLDLSRTSITELPQELGNLVNLRHLDLQRTRHLRKIPRESLLGLHRLVVLNLYYSYGSWGSQDGGNKDDAIQFADLEGLRDLKTLGITINDLETLMKLSAFGHLLKCIQYLYIKECEGLYRLQLPSTETNGDRVRRLSINNCYDLKYLAIGNGLTETWLNSLEVLVLHGLPNLATVWRNPVKERSLRNLRFLNIWYCHRLKNVSWILNLPTLEAVYLFYCREMEEVISEGMYNAERGRVAFPSLRTLSIRDLPELRTLVPHTSTFPSLESVAVINCSRLKKLPVSVPANQKLPTLYSTREWWDQLEWEDDTAKLSFLPQFMSI